MRTGRIVPLLPALLLPVWLACNPINISDDPIFNPGTQYAIEILKPDTDRQVSRGTLIEIEWAAANTTGLSAMVNIFLRNRSDFSETLLLGGEALTGTGATQTLTWDTAEFEAGEYSIVGRIQVDDQFKESGSAGRIIVNTPPEWTFTAPLVDVTLAAPDDIDPNDPNETREPNVPITTIAWIAFDPDADATATIEVDLSNDDDHSDGDEIVISTVAPTAIAEEQTFDWNGDDSNGARVAGGTYTVFARFSDPYSDEQIIEAAGLVTVPDEPNEPNFATGFSEPAEDTEFLPSTPSLEFLYSADQDVDAIVDLKIDTDDNHRNGNEITILAQQLVTAGTQDMSFDWNGEDENAVTVDDAIYRLFMVISRGTGTPELVDADGLILRRDDADKPLIAILAPDDEESASPGTFVTISWRDSDPTESSTITLVLDDDEDPDQVNETGDDELVILSGREASGTGVLDTFSYQIPANLDSGTYYVFAYIDRNGVAPFDHVSVAAGTIDVN